jgi:hypothetical protein
MSIWDIHYAALYASPIAVDAVLTVACGEVPITKGADGGPLRVIDKTAGVAIGGAGGGFNPPAASISTPASITAIPHA